MRRGARPARRGARRHAGRLLRAPQPARPRDARESGRACGSRTRSSGAAPCPVALSDAVRVLKTRQLLETAIAVAPCFDGDVQAVTTASALAWAKAKGFDVVVCGIGPGHRRDRLRPRSRRAGGRRGGQRGGRARRAGDRGRPLLGRRHARAPPWRLASHALGASTHPGRTRGGVAVRASIAMRRSVRWSRWTVEGWEDACAGLLALPHGSRAVRRPVVLRAAFAAGRHARTRIR